MELTINGFSVPLIVQRKQVKGINIRVTWDGRVKVSAPAGISDELIEKALMKKRDWIAKKLEEMEVRRKHLPQFVDGGSVWLLGKPVTLKVMSGERDKVSLRGRKLLVKIAGGGTERVKQLVMKWLQGQAMKLVSEKVGKFAPVLGLNHRGIELREWRSKWGLCKTNQEVLRFNWRLIQLPEDLIDYIVVHELAHLKYPKHDRDFWKFVAKFVPNWKEKHSGLREWGGVLVW